MLLSNLSEITPVVKRITALTVMALAIAFLCNSNGNAATINAASCSQSDVQTAIDSAVSGDIVVVPSGICAWTSPITIPHSKKITLQGAGMNNTIITRSSNGTVLDLGRSGSRVTGFGFKNGGILVDGYDFRIDHCSMAFDTWYNGIVVQSRNIYPAKIPTGVIDNCNFTNMRVLVNGSNYMLYENGAQHGLWASALNLGSAEAVYIENNIFTNGTNAVDGNYGGRYVFRYNTLNDTMIEAHSVQGYNRAIRKWEIYNNTINQVSRSMWTPFFLRGGTGVVFNNTINGVWTSPTITLDNVRSCTSCSTSGKCDGTSSWDGNELGKGGYPCRDQIGRSTDQWLWTSQNPYPPQALEPAYFWNNKHGVNDVGVYVHNCDANRNHIQQNRDWYFNVAKPGYKPYTYPHPLRQTDGDNSKLRPSAPKGLRIVN